MATHIVIAGGGTAGSIIANLLARGLHEEINKGEVIVKVIDKEEKHMYQPALLYVVFDRFRENEMFREMRDLLNPSVIFIHDEIEEFDFDGNTVRTKSGKKVNYDYLVIATGSKPRPDLVDGLEENGDIFYTLEGAKKLRDKLRKFDGGKVLVSVAAPHKCPVAPLEIIFMLDEYFRQKGIRDKIDLSYTYPIGRVHALEPVANWAVPEFEKRGINYETLFNMEKVEQGVVHSMEGFEKEFDLLIAIPPHKGSESLINSGIQDGWVPTDRHLLKAEGYDNVYVCGDTTNLPISKAGSTAHFEADVVAENLIAEIKEGHPARDYDGKVMCFIETGFSSATYVWFNYTTPPDPVPPSKMIHWLKLGYNRVYWLTARGIL
ncbi:NAD(P)/FAD-dependent oxidoreductase [Persephonella sp.]